MSLAVALHNYHGIVMCADKLINVTVDGTKMHQSFTEQKLFLVENKYGLSYTGTASVDHIPVSALIEKYLRENHIGNSDPSDWLLQFSDFFHRKLSDGQNIVFIFCGYYNNEKFVITTNTINPKIDSIDEQSGILYSGEIEFVKHIICSDLIAFDFTKFTIQDSVDFLRYLNSTIADMMHFGQYLPTVSRECNILIISPNMSCWESNSM